MQGAPLEPNANLAALERATPQRIRLRAKQLQKAMQEQVDKLVANQLLDERMAETMGTNA